MGAVSKGTGTWKSEKGGVRHLISGYAIVQANLDQKTQLSVKTHDSNARVFSSYFRETGLTTGQTELRDDAEWGGLKRKEHSEGEKDDREGLQ